MTRYEFLGQGSGFLQAAFHTGETDPSGFFRCPPAAPMGFETNGVAISVIFQGSELAHPIDYSLPDRRPLIFAGGVPDGALHVAVSNAIFRQQSVTVRIRCGFS